MGSSFLLNNAKYLDVFRLGETDLDGWLFLFLSGRGLGGVAGWATSRIGRLRSPWRRAQVQRGVLVKRRSEGHLSIRLGSFGTRRWTQQYAGLAALVI